MTVQYLQADVMLAKDSLKIWCRGTELNRRRQPFQDSNLPMLST